MHSLAAVLLLLILSIGDFSLGVGEIDLFSESRNLDYKLMRVALDFVSSHKKCSKKGGRLAVVKSVSDREKLLKSNPTFKSAFLGLSDVKAEGKFFWVNGAQTDAYEGIMPFAVDQPDDKDKKEDCTRMVKTEGKLADINCESPTASVCQFSEATLESQNIVNGVIFNSKVSGSLRLDFDENRVMKIRGMVGPLDTSKKLAIVLVHNVEGKSSLCLKPPPIFNVFRNFKASLKMIPLARDLYNGRQVIDASVDNIEDIEPSHYAIVIRELGGDYLEFDCQPVKAFPELQWYQMLSDNDFTFSTGIKL